MFKNIYKFIMVLNVFVHLSMFQSVEIIHVTNRQLRHLWTFHYTNLRSTLVTSVGASCIHTALMHCRIGAVGSGLVVANAMTDVLISNR